MTVMNSGLWASARNRARRMISRALPVSFAVIRKDKPVTGRAHLDARAHDGEHRVRCRTRGQGRQFATNLDGRVFRRHARFCFDPCARLVIALAARHRVPTMYPYRFRVSTDGLISYGVELTDVHRRARVSYLR